MTCSMAISTSEGSCGRTRRFEDRRRHWLDLAATYERAADQMEPQPPAREKARQARP
jgi:hypothetical protein